MKPIWKIFFAVAALPFRLIMFIFRGSRNGNGRLAGRYTRSDKLEDEPSANCLIG